MFSVIHFHVVFMLWLGFTKTTELRLTELLMFGLKIHVMDATNTAEDNPNFQSNNHKHSWKGLLNMSSVTLTNIETQM